MTYHYAGLAYGGMSEQDQWDVDGIPQCPECGQFGHVFCGEREDCPAHEGLDRWCTKSLGHKGPHHLIDHTKKESE